MGPGGIEKMTMRGAVYVNGNDHVGRQRLSFRSSIMGSCTAKASTKSCARQRRAVSLRSAHVTRLRNSARYLHLTYPSTTRRCARGLIRRPTRPAALAGDTYVRILLTRGMGELTYDVRATPTPSVVDHHQTAGRRAVSCALRRDPHLSRADPAQPSRLREPDHQVEQPSEQCTR